MIKLNNVTDIRTGQFYSTVVTNESKLPYFTPSDGGITIIPKSNDLEQRVSDLEDAVVELAEIITEE